MTSATGFVSATARGRRPSWAILIGAILFVAGAAGWLASLGMPGRTARVLGGNRPVNLGAEDRLDIVAHSSPKLVANPTMATNLAMVSRVDTPRFSCGLHVSFDGGSTWRESPIPMPVSKSVACFVPDLAFSADGTLYLAFTSFAEVEGRGNVPDAIWVAASNDGGRTVGAPIHASGPLAFQVRLAADPVQPDLLYLSWLQASQTSSWGFVDSGNPVVVSRSDDGGATWAAATRVSPPGRQRVVAPSIALGPKGELYVGYLDVGDDRLDYHGGHEGRGGPPYDGAWALVVARSADRGATWREALVDEHLVPTVRFLVLFPPTPSLAVDTRTGRVYAAFEDGRRGDADVRVWSSKDGGRQWGPGRRVNDTEPGDGRRQYLPALAVSPGGRLDVAYYDRRSDPDDVMNEVSLQSSFDGGSTFTQRLRLSNRRFDSRVGFGSDREMPDLGNRLGLLATDGGVLAVWTDTRGGTILSGKQAVAIALADLSPADPLQRPLRYGGALVALVGLALVARRVIRLVAVRDERLGDRAE